MHGVVRNGIMRRVRCGAVSAFSLLMAVAAGPLAAQDATVIEMTGGLDYAPSEIRIEAGETVTWRNVSEIEHTVTADPAKARDAGNVTLPDGAAPFDSGFIAAGASYSHTFDVPGEYRYFCIPHEAAGMVGTVIVE